MTKNIRDFIRSCEAELSETFAQIDEIADKNLERLLSAFSQAGLTDADMLGSTGYGLGDSSRDKLERIYAQIFGTESSLVRPQIASGTHAIASVLFGLLRPGDRIVSITGTPYDTLEEVIGIRESTGSLAEFGITYGEVDWRYDNSADLLDPPTKIVYIQRSSGDRPGPSVTIDQLSGWIDRINVRSPQSIIVVDNCYCEFVGNIEPGHVGADVVVGSLIKNPGGGLAKTGGYIASSKELIKKIATRVTAPGVGAEIGATWGFIDTTLQGFYLAPSAASCALKGSYLISECFSKLGYKVTPNPNEKRADIVSSIELGSREKFMALGCAIQSISPLDSTATPEPFPQGGYTANVMLAGGGFISGSTLELSADGLDEPPYTVYIQGGMNMNHIRLGLTKVIEALSQTK
ncbi:MAG: methionine gamma-lyase family protein [Caldisericia bacterium]|nr:methionine gamma-lyase family protein [Caldisericia bacterium]